MFNPLFTQDVLSEFTPMSRLFSNPADSVQNSTANYPKVNIAQSDGQVEIYAYVPGLDPASIDVTLDEQTLTLRGSKPAHDMTAGEQNFVQERYSGDFERTVRLPDDIDSSQVEALYENGVLRVTLNRQTKPVAQKITVNTK